MTTVEIVRRWLEDHSLEYTYSSQSPPQFGIKNPRSLIIIAPAPGFDDHVVVIWNTRRRRYDIVLNIADPNFFAKFETALK